MSEIFTPSGTVYRGDSAEIRLAIMDTDTQSFIDRSVVLSIRARLARQHPDPQTIASWSLNVEDVLSNGPIFHQQDPGWRFTDIGRNFLWSIPKGYLMSAPAKYRLIVVVEKVGLGQSTHVCNIQVVAP